MALKIGPTSTGPSWIIHRGATFTFGPFVVVDFGGVPRSLVGCAVRLLIGRSLYKVPQFEANVGTGITVTDAPNGELKVELSAPQTAAFEEGGIAYELLIIDSGGAVILQLKGGGEVARTLAGNLGDETLEQIPDGFAGLVAERPAVSGTVAETEAILTRDPARTAAAEVVGLRPLRPLLDAKADAAGTAAALAAKADAAATTAALATKAPLVSPAFTGAPTAPTPVTSDNSTRIATMAAVQAVVAALVNSSPAALDTLNELAASLGNDPNFATTMLASLAAKQNATTAPGDLGPGTVARSVADELRDQAASVRRSGTAGGGTDDAAALKAHLLALEPATDRRDIALPSTASGYGVGRAYAGSQQGLPVPPKQVIRGNGTKLSLLDNCSWFSLGRVQDRGDTTFNSFKGLVEGVDYAEITANAAATDVTLTCTAGMEAAFVAGDLAMLRLGQAAYDTAEPDYARFVTISSVSSGQITLKEPVGYALDVSIFASSATWAPGQNYTLNQQVVVGTTRVYKCTTPGTSAASGSGPSGVGSGIADNSCVWQYSGDKRNHRIVKCTGMSEQVTIEGLDFDGPASGTGNAESGIDIKMARNIAIRNNTGRNVGAGLVVAQFCEGLLLENNHIYGCEDRGQASKGRCLTISQCRNVQLRNNIWEGAENNFLFIEGGAENVIISGDDFNNNYPGRPSSRPIIFMSAGKDLLVENAIFRGNPSMLFDYSVNTNHRPPFIRNSRLTPEFSPARTSVAQWCHVDHIGDNVAFGSWFKSTRKLRWSARIELLPSKTAQLSVRLPKGLITAIRMTLDSKTGVTGVWVQDTVGSYPVPNPTTSAVSAMTDAVPFDFPKTSTYPWWSFGSNHGFADPSVNKGVYYTTGSTVPRGTMLHVVIEYYPADVGAFAVDSVTHVDVLARFSSSKAWDPPDLAAGASQTTTVTNVTEARTGDKAEVSFSLDTQGTILSAAVTADDTVTVAHSNLTGSSVNLGNGTLRVSTKRSQ